MRAMRAPTTASSPRAATKTRSAAETTPTRASARPVPVARCLRSASPMPAMQTSSRERGTPVNSTVIPAPPRPSVGLRQARVHGIADRIQASPDTAFVRYVGGSPPPVDQPAVANMELQESSKGSAPEPSQGEARAPTPVPIVGVGASAGGIEALEVLLEHLPVDTGVAIIVVLHLDPKYPSLAHR